jgi:hypothetical protein
MSKLALTGAIAVVALATFAGVGHAARITAEPGGVIELRGRFTIEAPTFGVNVTCDKTMRGAINAIAEGTLTLGGNNAGTITDIRFANCVGGTLSSEVEVNRPVRLAWVRVEARQIELTGLDLQLRLGMGCAYRILFELIGRDLTSTSRFERLSLRYVRLLSSREGEERETCFEARTPVTFTGNLTLSPTQRVILS